MQTVCQSEEPPRYAKEIMLTSAVQKVGVLTSQLVHQARNATVVGHLVTSQIQLPARHKEKKCSVRGKAGHF